MANKPVPSRAKVIQFLIDRTRKRLIDMEIAARDKGTDSIDYLWVKCEIETMEMVLYQMDPNYESHTPRD